MVDKESPKRHLIVVTLFAGEPDESHRLPSLLHAHLVHLFGAKPTRPQPIPPVSAHLIGSSCASASGWLTQHCVDWNRSWHLPISRHSDESDGWLNVILLELEAIGLTAFFQAVGGWTFNQTEEGGGDLHLTTFNQVDGFGGWADSWIWLENCIIEIGKQASKLTTPVGKLIESWVSLKIQRLKIGRTLGNFHWVICETATSFISISISTKMMRNERLTPTLLKRTELEMPFQNIHSKIQSIKR